MLFRSVPSHDNHGQIWANAYNGYCYKIALPIPAVPTSSITTSTIYSDTAVTLSCSTSGATIKYTTDGTTPSATNGTTYSAPFTVSATTTIKFCAIKDGYLTAGTDVVLTLSTLGFAMAGLTQLWTGSSFAGCYLFTVGSSLYLNTSSMFVDGGSEKIYKWNGTTWVYKITYSGSLSHRQSLTQYTYQSSVLGVIVPTSRPYRDWETSIS